MPEIEPDAPTNAGTASEPVAKAKPLPPAGDPPAATVAPPATQPPATTAPVSRGMPRNPIFAELVQGEDDLAGLVGYALYKLNKRDWLASFFKTHGRDPTESEISSYILGERTQRRLGTYRRLADDLIGRKAALAERNGQGMAAAPARVSAMKQMSARASLAGDAQAKPRRSATAGLLFWILVLIVLAGAGYYYVNYSSLFLGR